jgi:chemotaxis signal transduction protein
LARAFVSLQRFLPAQVALSFWPANRLFLLSQSYSVFVIGKPDDKYAGRADFTPIGDEGLHARRYVMSTMSNILLDKEILPESGTNELELLVFALADYVFGINVAEVREALPSAEITCLPQAHPSIRGVFKLRNQVSLLDHLGIESTIDNAESTLILTNLNQQQTAFLVDARPSPRSIIATRAKHAGNHTANQRSIQLDRAAASG